MTFSRSLPLALAGTLLVLSACQQLPQTSLVSGSQAQNRIQTASNRVSSKVSNPQSQTIPGQMIVKFKSGVNVQALMGTFQLKSLQTIGHPRLGIHLVASPQVGSQALNALRANPSIVYAEPNYVVSIPKIQPAQTVSPLARLNAATPNDPMFSKQYSHQVSNTLAGWNITKGSSDVVLAVVDTGVDVNHPDLAAKMVTGRDMVDDDSIAQDGHGHGTHCAGIAAAIANNKVGVAGFAPNVKIMPIRVLGDRGSGSSADVANGIIWAADHGADVISMSLGSSYNAQVKADAIKYALSKDIVLVAAMGNSGNGAKSYPAATEGVIAVGATDSADKIARFSQYGPWISVSAPGVNILSTFPTGSSTMGRKDYGSISGTSMATPAVAGVVALIRSQFPKMNSKAVRAQLEQGVDDLGDPGFDKNYGHGRVNVLKALTLPGSRR